MQEAVKLVMRCNNVTSTIGNFTNAQGMGTTTEYELTYLSIFVEGRLVIEIDKLNYVYQVLEGSNLVDYMRKVKQDVGFM